MCPSYKAGMLSPPSEQLSEKPLKQCCGVALISDIVLVTVLNVWQQIVTKLITQTFLNIHLSHHINPLNASCSCDGKIGGCWKFGKLMPCSPYVQHSPIKRHVLSQLTSHCCISSRISKFQWTLSVSKVSNPGIQTCGATCQSNTRRGLFP
jgi:hypothetical protein